ncbi:uncharacterized protein LOC142240501 [Haematobia irritans]|uniref:uncharacterized protein LOC142240501 n=1 Tax=Haematobia irritans TaxID=7368 RepID=UPI003F50CE8A
MVSKTLCNVIAYLSAILSGIGCVIFIFLLTTVAIFHNAGMEQELDEEDAESAKKLGVFFIVLLVMQVLACIGMLITSVLLIIGIKRDRVSFVAPWVYIEAIGVLISILRLAQSPNNILQGIVSIVIQIAMWYPIFTFYRELRDAPPAAQNVFYNPCPSNQQGAPPYNGPMDVEKNINANPGYNVYPTNMQGSAYNNDPPPMYPEKK